MRIAIDLDDTLCQTEPWFRKRATSLWGPIGEGYITPELVGRSRYHRLMSDWESFGWSEVAPIEGAAEALKSLDIDQDLAIVSARPVEMLSSSHRWLGRHGFPSLPVYHTPQKWLMEGFDLMVDDRAQNLELARGRGMAVCLIDQPWNRNSALTRILHIGDLRGLLRSGSAGRR